MISAVHAIRASTDASFPLGQGLHLWPERSAAPSNGRFKVCAEGWMKSSDWFEICAAMNPRVDNINDSVVRKIKASSRVRGKGQPVLVGPAASVDGGFGWPPIEILRGSRERRGSSAGRPRRSRQEPPAPVSELKSRRRPPLRRLLRPVS